MIPLLNEILPTTPRQKRRVVRRKAARVIRDTNSMVARIQAPTKLSSLTPEQIIARFPARAPDVLDEAIQSNIQAARDAEKQKALNDGLPWD